MDTQIITSQIHQLHHTKTESKPIPIDKGQRALSLSQELGDSFLTTKSHIKLAFAFIFRGKTKDAVYHLNQADKNSQIANGDFDDPPSLCCYYSCFGTYCCHLSRYWEAKGHYERVLEIANQIDASEWQRNALVNLGYVHAELGDWKQAIEFLRESIIHPYENLRQTLAAYNYLANIFEFQKQWDAAYPYRLMVAEQFPKNEPIFLATFFRRLAYTQTRLLKIDEAKASIETARGILEDFDNVDWPLARLDLVEGYWHLAQNNFECVEKFYQRGIRRVDPSENVQTFTEFKILNARKLFEQGDFKGCIDCLAELDESKMRLRMKRTVYKYQAEACEKLGRWQDAYIKVGQLQKTESVEQADLHVLYRLNEESYRLDLSRETNSLLKAHNAELEGLHHEKDEMFRIVAHDLKNPITALKTSLYLMKVKRRFFSEEKLDRRITACMGAVDRLDAIVSQLTAVGELESHLLNARTEPCPVFPELERLVLQHTEQAQAKKQQIVLHNSSLPSALIHHQCFDQIMSNLLSNAIKYSPPQTTIQVNLQEESGKVRIEVQDEGLGLSDDDKANLFKKYTRLSARPTGDESSLGLGLYITKRLVNGMNGSISASSPGKNMGSTFTVYLETCDQLSA